MNERDFPLDVVLTMTTGRLLCDFDKFHEAAEWLMGHPIWTHEFADLALFKELEAGALRLNPDLADFDASHITRDNWQAVLSEAEQKFGAMRPLPAGRQDRVESPLESLARIAGDKPIVAVIMD